MFDQSPLKCLEVFGCPLNPYFHFAAAIQHPAGKLVVNGNATDKGAEANALDATGDKDMEGIQSQNELSSQTKIIRHKTSIKINDMHD